jgi:hypothetical protein
MMTGMASGVSILSSSPTGPYPSPRAASRTSSGTAASPATMFRTRIVSEYRARPMTTLHGLIPGNGGTSMNENMASEGIV